MGKRVGMIDEVRGIAYIAMIIYHTYYDLAFIYGHAMPEPVGIFMKWLQPLIAGTFIVIAGISSNYSSNNFRRGVEYFFCAMLLTFVTAIFMPSEIILFGVLHFYAIAAMIYGFVGNFTERIPYIIGIVLFVLLFAVSLNIPRGYIGFEGLYTVEMPSFLYGHYWLFPLGFPAAGFYSSDYFPLIPNLFLFMAGASLGVYFKSGKASRGFYMSRFGKLAFIGRHGLLIYMLHQPVIILILEVVHKFLGQQTIFM